MITNCKFAGNRHCTRQKPVQPEQSPILKLIFLPFCTELHCHQARYCSTDGKYTGSQRDGSGFSQKHPKIKVCSKHDQNWVWTWSHNKTMHDMKLSNDLHLHEAQYSSDQRWSSWLWPQLSGSTVATNLDPPFLFPPVHVFWTPWSLHFRNIWTPVERCGLPYKLLRFCPSVQMLIMCTMNNGSIWHGLTKV